MPAVLPPVTTPVLLTVAVAALPVPHAPPVLVVLSVVVIPIHTCAIPVIGAGTGFTVTVALVKQPVPNV